MTAAAEPNDGTANGATESKATVPTPLANVPVASNTEATKGKKEKPKKADKPTAAAAKVAVVKVDFKRATDELKNKVPLPNDTMFVVNPNRSFNIHTALVTAINATIGNNDLKEVIAVDRKVILNKLCIAEKVTPLMCKKENKGGNATVFTYGNVPSFPDTFDSGSTTNYRLFGFLKHPVVVAEKWVALKYNTHLLVMNIEAYRKFSAGQMLEDKQVTIVGG